MCDSVVSECTNCIRNIWGPGETLVEMVLEIGMDTR